MEGKNKYRAEEQIPGNEFHFMKQLPGTSVIDVTNEDNSVILWVVFDSEDRSKHSRRRL
ncbi:MAG TPA: hypothetical protein VGI03_03680 [Verrucomicrobiae bacterium]|jgi:hypothetical protein